MVFSGEGLACGSSSKWLVCESYLEEIVCYVFLKLLGGVGARRRICRGYCLSWHWDNYYIQSKVINARLEQAGFWNPYLGLGVIEIRDLIPGHAPSYVLIRDPVRRLCHRMIAYSISGRGQAPEKHSIVFRHWSGGKNGAFAIRRVTDWALAMHFGLAPQPFLSDEGI
ncbi:hypothetical protein Tco_0193907 [Tanacetum coccineum]